MNEPGLSTHTQLLLPHCAHVCCCISGTCCGCCKHGLDISNDLCYGNNRSVMSAVPREFLHE